MSGIAGIWHRDGRPVHASSVERMLDYVSHRGPDGRGIWKDFSMTIGHVSLQVTPESRAEQQPLVDTSAGSVLTFDGRIDNRDELVPLLTDAGRPPHSRADAEIVLRACQAWGIDAPRRLLGDFAFAFWDEPRRTLLCARDARGIRPLCYRVDGARVAWASELQALVQPPFDQPAPNEGFIAEVLASMLSSTRETLYEGLCRLPPASRLVATPDAVRVETYWTIDTQREVRYRDDRDYEAHYLGLLRDAVDCRLRTDRPVGIMLSGGIDSSLVTGTAAALCSKRGRAPIRVYSLSYPGHPCDERPFVEDVARHLNLDATIVSDPHINRYEDDVRRYRDLPTYPSGAGSEALFVRARQDGVRLMLTGLGGDEWFSGHQAHYGDMLWRGQVVRLWRGVRDDIRSGAFGSWRVALWNTIRPNVPEPVLDLARRAAGHFPIPRWIRPSFAARVGLRDRVYGVPRRFGFPTRAQDEQFREAVAGFNIHANEVIDRTVSQYGLETAHPLDDRRLMEFGMALPEEQRWTGGYRKAIMRRAAVPFVPARTRTRTPNANYDHPYTAAMKHLHARARLAVPSRIFDEWVDRQVLLDDFDRVVGMPDAYDWPHWMAVAVRLWVDELVDDRYELGDARARTRTTA